MHHSVDSGDAVLADNSSLNDTGAKNVELQINVKSLCREILRREHELKSEAHEDQERVPLSIALGFPLALLCVILILVTFYCRRINRLKQKNEYVSRMYALALRNQGDSSELLPGEMRAIKKGNSEETPKKRSWRRSTCRKPLQTLFVREEGTSSKSSNKSTLKEEAIQVSAGIEARTPDNAEAQKSPQTTGSGNASGSPVPTINLLDCDEEGCKFVCSITPE